MTNYDNDNGTAYLREESSYEDAGRLRYFGSGKNYEFRIPPDPITCTREDYNYYMSLSTVEKQRYIYFPKEGNNLELNINQLKHDALIERAKYAISPHYVTKVVEGEHGYKRFRKHNLATLYYRVLTKPTLYLVRLWNSVEQVYKDEFYKTNNI